MADQQPMLLHGKDEKHDSQDEEQQRPLLDEGHSPQTAESRHLHTRNRLLTIYAAVVTCLLIALSVREVFRLWPLASKSTNLRDDLMLPEFKNRLRYKWVHHDPESWEEKTYSGPPSVPVEQAWNRLLRGNRSDSIGIRVSAEEAERFNITESQRYEDGRYAGIVAMHHNLHCLRRLRQLLYYDAYYSDASDGIVASNDKHLAHCIEVLRTSIMCTPDLSVLPLTPTGEIEIPLKSRPASQQYCLDWDSYNEIVDERN